MKEDGLGIFVGQTKTRIVQGKCDFMVRNYHINSNKEPEYMHWAEQNHPKELTKLEELYKEFCKNAYHLIMSSPSYNGPDIPHRIIFPDFYYSVIKDKFPIE